MQLTLSVSPEARQRCFGAASRDRRKPCRNPKLARAVVPTPDNAVLTPNIPCTPLKQDRAHHPVRVRRPGSARRAPRSRSSATATPPTGARRWRSSRRSVKWRGVSITRSGCPYTRATARLDPASRRNAVRAAGTTRSRAGSPPTRRSARCSSSRTTTRRRRQATAAGRVRGEDDGLHAGLEVPAEVRQAGHRHPRHAEVDAGHARTASARDGRSARTPAARARCRATTRSTATRPPSAAARDESKARQGDRHDVVLLQPAKCFPVVGGALVYKDISHLTDVFASSLGPYLLRKIRALNGY